MSNFWGSYQGRLGEDPQTPSRHRFPVALTIFCLSTVVPAFSRPWALPPPAADDYPFFDRTRACIGPIGGPVQAFFALFARIGPIMDLYGHLSGKQEKNLTRSTWQVTKTTCFVPRGMLKHGGGNVFKGFCYLREAQDPELAQPPRFP